jgi:glycine/D-amino acid oxidase-like deaminating enzyme
MQRVAVIGAGVVGTSIAFRLAQAGASVMLVDRGDPARGTTASSFAWANANQKTPRAYFELNNEGVREHKRLRTEFGAAPWLHCDGNLIWSEDRAELEARVARLLDWGYAAEWHTASDVTQSLEPNLRFADTSTRVAYFPQECWVDAPQLARALIEQARAHGAETKFGHAVTGISLSNGQVTAIQLEGSDPIAVDVVVNAAGPSADLIARLVGRALPLGPTGGLLVRVQVDGAPVGRVIHTPQVNIRPDGDGFVLLQHDSIDQQLGERRQIELSDPLVHELFERAQAIVGGLDDATIADARIGVRPYPRDGVSCAGAVSSISGYYEAVTHSGVTLGPLLGRLLAREIVDGTVDSLLADFRPDRFAGSGVHQ